MADDEQKLKKTISVADAAFGNYLQQAYGAFTKGFERYAGGAQFRKTYPDEYAASFFGDGRESAVDRLIAARRGGQPAGDFETAVWRAVRSGVGVSTAPKWDDNRVEVNFVRNFGCGMLKHSLNTNVSRREMDSVGRLHCLTRIIEVAVARIDKKTDEEVGWVSCAGDEFCTFCDRRMDRGGWVVEGGQACAAMADGSAWRLALTDQEAENGVRRLCDWTQYFMATEATLSSVHALASDPTTDRGRLLALRDELAEHKEQLRSRCRDFAQFADQLRDSAAAAEAAARGEPSEFESEFK